jgi:hypothetical protein
MRNFSLGEKYKIFLLLGRQVANHPTDAVHRQQTISRIFIRNALQATYKFTACKT